MASLVTPMHQLSTMLTQHHLTTLAVTISFAHLIKAIATASSLSPYPDSILYSWSTEPVCTTTARKIDCTAAYAALCARVNLDVSDNSTVGDCTAFYWYDAGNTIPTAAECTAAYTQILATSVRTFWSEFFLFGIEIDLQDVFREQSDLSYSRDLSCTSNDYPEEAMLTPKCA